MTDRVYVHVGPFKTGTTYVQGLLAANVERLAEQGVLYPRGSFGRQSRAIRDALGQDSMPASGRKIKGEWRTLTDELEGWHGTSAVLSHETLSAAHPPDIARLCRKLRAYDIHMIYTARDLTRVAPAMWQTGLRSKHSYTWEEYAEALRAPEGADHRGGRRFWQCQDAPAVLERWHAQLPLENLHLVTVPRPGNPPELLWQRFCQVLAVDPAGHDLQPRRSNPSLGTAEAELLRRVNARLDGSGIDDRRWLSWARWLGRELEQRPAMDKFSLPQGDLAWLTERAEQIVASTRAAGYPLVGDLDELLPKPEGAAGRHPSDTSDAAVLDAAVDALHRTVLELAKHQRGRSSGD